MRVAEVGEVRQCHSRLEQRRHAAFLRGGKVSVKLRGVLTTNVLQRGKKKLTTTARASPAR